MDDTVLQWQNTATQNITKRMEFACLQIISFTKITSFRPQTQKQSEINLRLSFYHFRFKFISDTNSGSKVIEVMFLFRCKKKKKVIDTLIQDQFKANVIDVVMLQMLNCRTIFCLTVTQRKRKVLDNRSCSKHTFQQRAIKKSQIEELKDKEVTTPCDNYQGRSPLYSKITLCQGTEDLRPQGGHSLVRSLWELETILNCSPTGEL